MAQVGHCHHRCLVVRTSPRGERVLTMKKQMGAWIMTGVVMVGGGVAFAETSSAPPDTGSGSTTATVPADTTSTTVAPPTSTTLASTSGTAGSTTTTTA